MLRASLFYEQQNPTCFLLRACMFTRTDCVNYIDEVSSLRGQGAIITFMCLQVPKPEGVLQNSPMRGGAGRARTRATCKHATCTHAQGTNTEHIKFSIAGTVHHVHASCHVCNCGSVPRPKRNCTAGSVGGIQSWSSTKLVAQRQ